MNPTITSSAPIIPNLINQQPQVNIQIVPPPQPQTLPPNLPLGTLLTGSRENYIKIGVPLYEASIKGDWEAAKAILDKDPDLIKSGITENYETPLHVAASAKNTKSVENFVQNLVNLMDKKDMELQNKNHNTALSLAAAAGYVKMVEIMVERNNALPEIPGSNEMMPLYVAALFGKHNMVRYLYNKSKKMNGDFWTDQKRGWVLEKCVEANLFDVALQIVIDRPELITDRSVLRDVLSVLARKTDEINGIIKPDINIGIIRRIIGIATSIFAAKKESEALKLLKIIWGNIAVMPKNMIDMIIRGKASAPDKYPSRVLFVAAQMGNTRFIVELIRLYPDLIWKKNDKGLSIFHVAVKHRHEEIYNLLYEIGSMKDLITPLKDEAGNNMLHLVGKSAKTKRLKTVSGVALQMQRELLWYQEVEQMIPPAYREQKNKPPKKEKNNDDEKNKPLGNKKKNNDDDAVPESPYELFTRKHKELVKEGEKWMKDTAAQCMVVATLIATIVFAAAFTLPGGYNQNTGIPIFVPKGALVVFVIADAISLIFSSASVLMFLSILTSRYAQHDFLVSLPTKLMFGLGALFLSILTMMVAFSASFYVLYHNNLKWVPIIVTGFAGTPVVLFAILQFRLLADVFYSTYRSRYLFKPNKRMLYD